MGDIYAAASLTLIAATGSDPTHGLPGIFPNARSPIGIHEELDSNLTLTALPCIGGEQDVAESIWATRAWTFQEGYLTRRRLIFTDTQYLFVCNSERRYEIGNIIPGGEEMLRWMPRKIQLQNFNSFPRDPEIERYNRRETARMSMRYLEEYTSRRLTFDSDALCAIVGALNVLARNDKYQAYYHLWGVPFVFESGKVEAMSREGNIMGLMWVHKNPARRRSEFPSWSPVGWCGKVDFSVSHLGVDFQDGGKDFKRKEVACDTGAISAHWTGWTRLAERQVQSENSYDRSRWLPLRAKMARLKLDRQSEVPKLFLEDHSAKVDIMLTTCWDIRANEIKFLDHIAALSLPVSWWKTSTWLRREDSSRYILLVSLQGGVYERVGIGLIPFLDMDGKAVAHYNNDWQTFEHVPGWIAKNSADKNWWHRYFESADILLG